MRRPVKWTLWGLGGIAGIALLLGLAAILILPSGWFRGKVRDRMVYEIERASGGRTEIGEFRFDWKTMTAEVAPFVLRGTEPRTEKPLFRADRVQVGLKIISMMQRDVDIASLRVDAPHINILVDERGRTNFPEPKIKRTSEKSPVERLLDLAVARIDLHNGWVRYADREIPVDIKGEKLQARLDYNFDGPSYRGAVSMNQLEVASAKTAPLAFDLETQIGLYANRIQVESAQLRRGATTMSASGSVNNFKDPTVQMVVTADASLADVGAQLRLPKPHVGRVRFNGNFTYNPRDRLLIAGRAQGSGLALHQSGIRVENIGVNTDVRWTLEKIELRATRVDALGGRFAGTADIVDFARLQANGRIDGISLATVSRMAGVKNTPYSAGVSGPVEVTMTLGGRDLRAGGNFVLTPAAGGVPVRGTAQVAYDQRRNTIELGNSHLLLPGTSIDASGTLGSELKVRIETRDLNDLLPALAMVGEAPEQLPLTLQPNGTAVFAGAVSGPVKAARATGQVTITNFTVQQQKIDGLVANIDADASSARIASFALGQDNLRLEGSATVGLQNWKAVDAAPLKANLKLQGAAVEKLLAAAGQKFPISGQMTAFATAQGTIGDPRLAVKLEVREPVVYGEKLDRIRAEVQYAGTGVEVINGVAELGTARVLLKGAFEHAPGDYKNGRLRFDASTQGFALQSVANVQRLRPGVQGRFEMAVTGSARLQNGILQPDRLDGVLGLRDLVVDGRPVGNFNVRADTSGTALNFTVAGNLRGSNVSGKGGFELTGDYPGKGSVEFSAITLSTLQDLLLAARGTQPMPFDGVVEGRVEFSGPAKKPELIRARMDLPALQIVPSRPGLTPAQIRDLTLRNEGPVVFEYDGKTVAIRSAHLVGRDTNMRATGTFALGEKNPWDLRVDGTLNLATVQNFNADVTSSGLATVNASVRGSLDDPQVTGRMELNKASFYLTDLPNGLDNANGTILFDKRRATIEKLTAETGGGTISMAGFVGFGSELSYRLSARADNVRVRYPEGVSTTVSSTLSLTGSATKSMLGGVVTVRRASFNPRTDVGGILATSARPVATPLTPNPYLRGMQLDVRVETAPGLQFQTALTNDLQAEADLRIRGTAARPTLLGRVSVNQGEVQFFGNKYIINRGEISFYNPAKIEPVLDMDLETRVRGVLVTINFTGPLSRLNVSYRSDPPLQSTEIVALLAVGRAPGTNSSLASGQTVATQGVLSGSGNTLLGQAVAAPISGRLQRFFGVSRLKIDPQLTGINAVPQARLTVEQQVSRDVTLTYITNLAEANQQIVRVEWDITRNWSVVALREDNGAFGIDFFFKKRFK